LDENAGGNGLHSALHVEIYQAHGSSRQPSLFVPFLHILPYTHSILVESLRIFLGDEGLELQHTLRSLGALRIADAVHNKTHDVCHVGGFDGNVATRDEGFIKDQLLVELELKDESELQEVV